MFVGVGKVTVGPAEGGSKGVVSWCGGGGGGTPCCSGVTSLTTQTPATGYFTRRRAYPTPDGVYGNLAP